MTNDKRLCDLFFGLVLALSSVLILLSLKNVNFFNGADEGYYLKYAAYISKEGIGGFSGLFKQYISDTGNWFFPSPLRAGFIALAALWVKAFGENFLSLAYLSLSCYIFTAFVCYCFIRKYFGAKVALLAGILIAFSPLNMAMARRALCDSASNLLIISTLWLFYDLAKSRANWKYVLFILSFTLAILVKEIAVLLSLVFLFYLIFDKIIFKKNIDLKYFLSLILLPPLIAFVAWVILSGNVLAVLDTIRIILYSPKVNDYAGAFGSGPWFRYIIDYILLSPPAALLSIGFIFFTLCSKENQEKLFYFLSVFIMLFVLLNFFTKNVRYVMALDMLMRLFTVLAIKQIFEACRLPQHRVFFALLIFIGAIAVFDYFSFYNLFIREGIYDPASYLLLKAYHVIPWK